MPFITQGKTNLKYILIVVVLAVIVGGGILGYYYSWIKGLEAKLTELELRLPEGTPESETGPPSVQPIITFLSPKEGEEWAMGQTYAIKWEIKNPPANQEDWVVVGSVRTEPALEGKTGQPIFKHSLKDDTGYFTWTVSYDEPWWEWWGQDLPSVLEPRVVVCLKPQGLHETYIMGFISCPESLDCDLFCDFVDVVLLTKIE